MNFNFYSNILEGGSDFAKSNYVEGGKNAKGEDVLSKDEANTLFKITNHDFFTTFIFQLYFYLIRNSKQNKDEILIGLKKIHKLITDYNKNDSTFKLKKFDKDEATLLIADIKRSLNRHLTTDDIEDIFDIRNNIIETIKTKLPSVAYKNCIDKDKEYSRIELSVYARELNDIINDFILKYNSISTKKAKNKFISNMFDSYSGIKEWKNYIKNHMKILDYSKEKLKELLDTVLSDTEVIFETKNYTFLKVNSEEDIKWLGCTSHWCIAIKPNHWNDVYAIDFVYLLINWSKNQDDYEFLHLIGKPFMFRDGTYFYKNYKGEGFFDKGNLELKKSEDIKAAWQPFQDELSSSQLKKLRTLDNIYFDDNEKYNLIIEHISEQFKIKNIAFDDKKQEIIVNEDIIVTDKNFTSLLNEINMINGDLTFFIKNITSNTLNQNLILNGSLNINSADEINIPKTINVTKNLSISSNNPSVINSLPEIGGKVLCDTEMIKEIRHLLKEKNLTGTEQFSFKIELISILQKNGIEKTQKELEELIVFDKQDKKFIINTDIMLENISANDIKILHKIKEINGGIAVAYMKKYSIFKDLLINGNFIFIGNYVNFDNIIINGDFSYKNNTILEVPTAFPKVKGKVYFSKHLVEIFEQFLTKEQKEHINSNEFQKFSNSTISWEEW